MTATHVLISVGAAMLAFVMASIAMAAITAAEIIAEMQVPLAFTASGGALVLSFGVLRRLDGDR